MKKQLTIVLSTLAVGFGVVSVLNTGPVGPKEYTNVISATVSKALAEVSPKMNVSPEQKLSTKSPTDRSDVFVGLASRQELERRFENESLVDLRLQVDELNSKVVKQSLVEKFNNHSISDDELKELAHVARLRIVLTSLIVRKELAEMKAKYKT